MATKKKALKKSKPKNKLAYMPKAKKGKKSDEQVAKHKLEKELDAFEEAVGKGDIIVDDDELEQILTDVEKDFAVVREMEKSNDAEEFAQNWHEIQQPKPLNKASIADAIDKLQKMIAALEGQQTTPVTPAEAAEAEEAEGSSNPEVVQDDTVNIRGPAQLAAELFGHSEAGNKKHVRTKYTSRTPVGNIEPKKPSESLEEFIVRAQEQAKLHPLYQEYANRKEWKATSQLFVGQDAKEPGFFEKLRAKFFGAKKRPDTNLQKLIVDLKINEVSDKNKTKDLILYMVRRGKPCKYVLHPQVQGYSLNVFEIGPNDHDEIVRFNRFSKHF